MHAVSIWSHLNAISDVVAACCWCLKKWRKKVRFARASVFVNLFWRIIRAHIHSCMHVIECVCLHCFHSIFIVITGARVCSPLRSHFFAALVLLVYLFAFKLSFSKQTVKTTDGKMDRLRRNAIAGSHWVSGVLCDANIYDKMNSANRMNILYSLTFPQQWFMSFYKSGCWTIVWRKKTRPTGRARERQ